MEPQASHKAATSWPPSGHCHLLPVDRTMLSSVNAWVQVGLDHFGGSLRLFSHWSQNIHAPRRFSCPAYPATGFRDESLYRFSFMMLIPMTVGGGNTASGGGSHCLDSLMAAVDRCFQVLLVDQAHEFQILGANRARRIVERGPDQPQQLAFAGDARLA
jgi:hypothetical protein